MAICRGDIGRGSLRGFLYLSRHVLERVHTRQQWWPVNELHISLQWYPFLNNMKIVYGSLVLIELLQSIAMNRFTRGTTICFNTCLYWGRLYVPLPILVATRSGIVLQPLGCWGRGFESRSRYGCLYVVLSCVGRGLCDGLITRPEESYRVSVCVWSRNPEKGGQRSVLDYKRLW
jgi:hypothetical protein